MAQSAGGFALFQWNGPLVVALPRGEVARRYTMYNGDTGFLTLLMNIAGPILLGLAIAYLVVRGRADWRQRQTAEAATERLYERTEDDRQRKENPSALHDNGTPGLLLAMGAIALGVSLGLAQIL